MPSDQLKNNIKIPTTSQKNRKISVCHFRDRCIGCAACEMVDPKNWKIDEDGQATLINSKKIHNFYKAEVDSEDRDLLELASELCPTGIIRIDGE